ncbi:hypothetical protein [Nonomuraea endophytica]|uniref:DUF3592 domain-containing protein n=1 Tax=Nonomuraea endophytica TaxID=714136 RepID=A0A7W7ZZ78_9ACTN|nr:hypothetical protein [Nonomuraea endophytica]MBB5076552.1 hypothetical protein [Nonomuraea endophytica]
MRAGVNSRFTVVVATVTAALLLALAVPNLGPVVRAARAEGTWGTFTAGRLSCVTHPGGHEACAWYGRFATASGAREVSLYGSARDTMAQGQALKAVDVGRPAQVYTEGGSNEWILTFALVLIGLVLLYPLFSRLRRRITY